MWELSIDEGEVSKQLFSMKCKVEAVFEREVKRRKKLEEEVTILRTKKARFRAMRSYENFGESVVGSKSTTEKTNIY